MEEMKYMSSVAANAIPTESAETENARRYRSIIQAVRLINKSREQVDKQEGLGFTISPAWRLLNNAAGYLLKQANTVLRGEHPS